MGTERLRHRDQDGDRECDQMNSSHDLLSSIQEGPKRAVWKSGVCNIRTTAPSGPHLSNRVPDSDGPSNPRNCIDFFGLASLTITAAEDAAVRNRAVCAISPTPGGQERALLAEWRARIRGKKVERSAWWHGRWMMPYRVHFHLSATHSHLPFEGPRDEQCF